MSNRRFSEYERETMYRCAVRYYIYEEKQTDISSKLGITRQKVSDYLKYAPKEGILDIKAPRTYKLEGELIKECRLWDARIVMVNGDLPEDGAENRIIKALGAEAASYFEEKIKDGAVVGLSGGRTIGQMVSQLNLEKYRELEVLPLSIGGGAPEIVDVASNTLVGIMCMRGDNVKGWALQLPPLTASAEEAERERDEMLSRPGIREIYERAMNVDFGFAGIGYLGPEDPDSTLVRTIKGLIPNPDSLIENLRAAKAVGDLAYQAFNIHGDIIDCELNRRVVAVPLKQFQEIVRNPNKHIVAVAGGHTNTKAGPILGAIRGGLIDVIISDEYTADEVLRLKRFVGLSPNNHSGREVK